MSRLKDITKRKVNRAVFAGKITFAVRNSVVFSVFPEIMAVFIK